jgi:glutamine amidotransferase
MKIAIIDYGMGNLRSVEKAFEHVGYPAEITSDPELLKAADKVVLPGVGAFGDGMRELRSRNLVDVIKTVIDSGTWFLGICLGLQLLFSESEEAPGVEGLNIIQGTVPRFRQGITVPHMGWNQLNTVRENPLLADIPPESYFYFVHSYYVAPTNGDVVVATTDYDIAFVSMVGKDNLFATQFHPEKSQTVGLRMLTNFCRL